MKNVFLQRKGSFVPCQEQRDLRDLTRYRRKLIQNLSAEHNRMIRIFEDANMKLSNLTGTPKPEEETGLNNREAKTVASSTRMKIPVNLVVLKHRNACPAVANVIPMSVLFCCV
ncbi:MAG: IS110 family transposase [Dysgonamonadaceae bacterium]|jgi:hypothetical protein|nr:IS110 family transposase [Dysgonamonadaceae bacterium]